MRTFIGRKRELRLLNGILKRKTASFVVLKGRRRIGKSRLVEEFGKTLKKYITITGLPPEKQVTAQDQRDTFATQLARQVKQPPPNSSDWDYLFWGLAEQCKSGRVLILLDEISWMGSLDPTFLGKLKNAWDLYFNKNDQLVLVICGSVSSWIDKNILSSTAFVGRINLKISLKELLLPDCEQFWGAQAKNISAYEKLKILAVTGGVPRYLESIISSHSAEENIRALCFTPEGLLFDDFEAIFNDVFGRRSVIYKKILYALIKSPHATLNEIYTHLGIEKQGVISEYLADLIMAGFVIKDYSLNIKSGKQSKFSQYRIADNYVRFYLKYIEPNKDKIERGAFLERDISTLPGWVSIMGLQFENLVLNSRKQLYSMLNIKPETIVYDNPYYQPGTKTRKGCQIDYLILTRFNSVYVCEIKFSAQPIGVSVINEVKVKIASMNLPGGFSYRPVLICVNGVTDELIAEEYFSDVINFSDLLMGS